MRNGFVIKWLPAAAVLTGLLSALPAFVVADAKALSDQEKKKIVYQMYAEGKKDFPAVKDLSPQQAMALLKQGRLVFVDTRKPAEMKVSMLPGAITKKAYLVEPGRYKDRTVVAYCTISYRSGVFAREMGKKGYTVTNLKGGILAWALEGGSVYDPQGRRTRRIHVYAERWNYAPQGYQTVMFSLWEQLFLL
jgi:sodium/bile acid cotransporter 7